MRVDRRSPALPLEVCYCIIDTFSCPDDLDTLVACSKVCKSFRPSCERLIFTSIQLVNFRHEGIHFRPTLLVDEFKDMLGKNSRLSIYIKNLYLIDDSKSMIKLGNPNLPIILNQLHKLNALTLTSISNRHIDWKIIPEPMRMSLRRLFGAPSITHLHLVCIKNFPIPWLFASSTSLKDLNVAWATFDPPTSVKTLTLGPNAPIPELCSFTLDLDMSLDVGKELVTMKRPDGLPVISFASLESLSFSLDMNTRDQTEIMKQYLSIAVRLRSLSLRVLPCSDELPFMFVEFIHPLALKTLHHLRLDFSLQYGDPYFGAQDELKKLASSNCPLKTLHIEVCLGIWDNADHVMDVALWNKLDEVLTIPNFSNLQEVSLAINLFLENYITESAEELCDRFREVVEAAFSMVASEPRIKFSLLVDFFRPT